MKIAVCTVAYREERFIKGCISQFKDKVDLHLVLHSNRSWMGNTDPLDATVEIATNQGANVTVISSDWDTEAQQRNFGQGWLEDYDWILIVDADERYEPEVIDKWLEFLKTAKEPAYGMGRVLTYWKDWEHRVDPEESPGLITSVKPSVRFTHLRNIDSNWANLPKEIVCHHGSYVRTDEEMRQKIENFGHANEIVPYWYQEKWLADNPLNCHPTHPEIFQKTVKCKKVVED